MGDNSKIEWCDHTFNPWEGCTKVGPGCDHCYAEARNHRFGGGNWGPGAPRRRTSEANWKKPLKWNREAALGRFVQCDECGLREFRKWDDSLPPGGLACCSNPECMALPETDSFPVRPRVFCASLADWLDNEVPIEWLIELLDLIRITPDLDWLLLTKRIGNWANRIHSAIDYIAARLDGDSVQALWAVNFLRWLRAWLNGSAPENIWIGATVVNQKEADRDIPKLLDVPAEVCFLSMEPLLGSVDLTSWIGGHVGVMGVRVDPNPKWIDWIIVGGESGSSAKPMHPEWVRSIRDQCQAAGVPFLFKQWGEWAPRAGKLTGGGTNFEVLDPGCEKWPDVIRLGEHGKNTRICENCGPDAGEEVFVQRVGKKNAGRLLDCRTWDGFPGPSIE